MHPKVMVYSQVLRCSYIKLPTSVKNYLIENKKYYCSRMHARMHMLAYEHIALGVKNVYKAPVLPQIMFENKSKEKCLVTYSGLLHAEQCRWQDQESNSGPQYCEPGVIQLCYHGTHFNRSDVVLES